MDCLRLHLRHALHVGKRAFVIVKKPNRAHRHKRRAGLVDFHRRKRCIVEPLKRFSAFSGEGHNPAGPAVRFFAGVPIRHFESMRLRRRCVDTLMDVFDHRDRRRPVVVLRPGIF